MNYLTEEGFSFHTFELKKSLTFDEYRTIKNAIYSLAKIKKYRVYQIKNSVISEQYKRYGILIKLYDNGPNLPHMELRVNPRLACEDYNYIGIFNCTEENIKTAKNRIDELLSMVCSPYLFDELTFSRIDFCVNIQLNDPLLSDQYMRCIRKCFVPKSFHRDRFTPDEWNYKEKNKQSFRASQKESVFTIYDKVFQLGQEHLLQSNQHCPAALIRFEVSFKRPAIKKLMEQSSCSTERSNTEFLRFFGLTSRFVLERYVRNFFPEGVYLTYQKAKETILRADIKRKIRKRMLTLLENASSCGNLNSAVLELKRDLNLTDYQVDHTLSAFEKLHLNPVTLPNQGILIGIQGIYQLLFSVEPDACADQENLL